MPVLGYDTISLSEPEPMKYFYDTSGAGLPIFYNMYLSVEISTLFESSGAVFNQLLLNPVSKASEYLTSSKKALNLGVYAVDLSYSRFFGQIDIAGRYFNGMQTLSEELGIPSDYFEIMARRFENNINNRDSLISIANEVYMATDTYLKSNERHNVAALVIVGGWVEAVYLACDMAVKTRDIDIIDRLAEQSYSLVNLLEMLESYRKDVMVERYINSLAGLKPAFTELVKSLESDFDAGKPLTSTSPEMQVYINRINVLYESVKLVRTEITE